MKFPKNEIIHISFAEKDANRKITTKKRKKEKRKKYRQTIECFCTFFYKAESQRHIQAFIHLILSPNIKILTVYTY